MLPVYYELIENIPALNKIYSRSTRYTNIYYKKLICKILPAFDVIFRMFDTNHTLTTVLALEATSLE
jgi:hypothetical protein